MIIYFSGSGNSLAVARKIAEKTDDRLIHLNDAAETDLAGESVIGLIYPAYSWDAPLIVKSLVPRLSISPAAYVYIVVTCGSTPGNAIPTVIEILSKKGINVQYSRIISVPDSSAICFGNNANEQFDKFGRVPAAVDEIVRDVTERRQSLTHHKRGLQANFINSRAFFPIATWLVRQHVNNDKCIGCGICANVCPCKNIALISVLVLLCAAGFYVWGKTAMARAYWMPLAVSGVFLVAVAGGLFFANNPRIEKFQEQYQASPETFVQAELDRTAKSDHDLNLIVYTVLPIFVIVCGVLVVGFKDSTHTRAWLITLMLLGSFLMVVDSNTKARNSDYRTKLIEARE